jgi:hypothetical protein
VACVYLRPEVLVIDRETFAQSPTAPDADRALKTLTEYGLAVAVVGDPMPEIGSQFGLRQVTRLPARDPGAWLITTTLDDCPEARRSGIRTALIGGNSTGVARCDLTAASLFGAVMEILAADGKQGSSGT